MTAAVLTISDGCSQGTQQDLSGPALVQRLQSADFTISRTQIIPDDQPTIVAALQSAASVAQIVLTTGGTGLAARDVTPEATIAACDRLIPGIAEKMRADGLTQTPFASLSRGICGTIPVGEGKWSLVLNLPGSPKGAIASLQAVLPILPHALDLLAGKTKHS